VVLKLAAPAVAMMACNFSFNLIDTIWWGLIGPRRSRRCRRLDSTCGSRSAWASWSRSGLRPSPRGAMAKETERAARAAGGGVLRRRRGAS